MTTDTIKNISKSPVTGKEYEIPASLNDKIGIDDFIALHPGKKVVVVQGLGFVGSVMGLVVAGLLNKQIAGELGTSETTIKIHRHQVMEKMGAGSLAELVRMADRLGIPTPK